jgi:hypothetical protein
MIEKTLKTTTGKIKVKIPSALNEVSLGQMMEMQENPGLNDLEAISILAEIPINELQNVCNIDDFSVFADTVLSLSNQIKYLYHSDEIPKKIAFTTYIGNPTINVTSNLSVEPAGAFMAARDIIADEINEHIKLYAQDDWQQYFNPSLKACCQVLAHYFFCRVTGKKYNEYEAEEFCNEVKKLRVTEALPIAKHFFSFYPSLSKQKTSFLHRFRRFWKKRQGYNHLKSLSISTP